MGSKQYFKYLLKWGLSNISNSGSNGCPSNISSSGSIGQIFIQVGSSSCINIESNVVGSNSGCNFVSSIVSNSDLGRELNAVSSGATSNNDSCGTSSVKYRIVGVQTI
ncbi:hypothetical protein DICPUDRAFT_77003 [Dictyostelium purpureum]|uniref:Uncharacterized protein n=1 Tax=Dictyostelium purpureum TaxID=5786 RepID=F0ZFB2_DICPU|nr:uncharacterized protein DICPUDRAFT_77003 [Dictyostelium purpureum]EGC37375.1 hypothetical protein DICPUDRAFT_77003 [Dictyostelium purpureum]|eukprot:XP_003286116.1 hypothetical protein DICPUDRAFT_77003 [Dictyostelium purpureum]